MSGQFPPLDCREFKRILTKLGFAPRPPKSGTSHEQWVRDNPYRKVTVDCPKAPFTGKLLDSMIKQTGLTKKKFFEHR
ncbi:MAG: type II toxin-antitoxin system HicA family toxin [Vulcanimicrobiaceae bacterium]